MRQHFLKDIKWAVDKQNLFIGLYSINENERFLDEIADLNDVINKGMELIRVHIDRAKNKNEKQFYMNQLRTVERWLAE